MFIRYDSNSLDINSTRQEAKHKKQLEKVPLRRAKSYRDAQGIRILPKLNGTVKKSHNYSFKLLNCSLHGRRKSQRCGLLIMQALSRHFVLLAQLLSLLCFI